MSIIRTVATDLDLTDLLRLVRRAIGIFIWVFSILVGSAIIGAAILFGFLHFGFLTQAMAQKTETVIRGEVVPGSIRTGFRASLLELETGTVCVRKVLVLVRLKGLREPLRFSVPEQIDFDLENLSGHIVVKLSKVARVVIPQGGKDKADEIYYELLEFRQMSKNGRDPE